MLAQMGLYGGAHGMKDFKDPHIYLPVWRGTNVWICYTALFDAVRNSTRLSVSLLIRLEKWRTEIRHCLTRYQEDINLFRHVVWRGTKDLFNLFICIRYCVIATSTLYRFDPPLCKRELNVVVVHIYRIQSI